MDNDAELLEAWDSAKGSNGQVPHVTRPGQTEADRDFRIIIPGPCVPKARPRVTIAAGKAWAYNPKRSADYAEQAAWEVKKAMLAAGQHTLVKPTPVQLEMTFWQWRKWVDLVTRPDLVNLEAQICDILKVAGVYEDDSQVTNIHSRKAPLSSKQEFHAEIVVRVGW